MRPKPSPSEQPPIAWWELLIAGPLLAIVTVLGWQFADLLWAEQLLHRAATAAAREALLPKATPESVAASAWSVLRETKLAGVADDLIVTINSQSVLHHPLDLLESGDQVEVTLGAYAIDAAPDMLRFMGLSLGGRKLRATAVAIKP